MTTETETKEMVHISETDTMAKALTDKYTVEEDTDTQLIEGYRYLHCNTGHVLKYDIYF